MFEFFLNAMALSLSIGAIWLTAGAVSDKQRRLGCMIGIVASVLNLALQADSAPWSTVLLSVVCLIIYLKSLGAHQWVLRQIKGLA